jgi:hypothetical protein
VVGGSCVGLAVGEQKEKFKQVSRQKEKWE